MARYLRHITLLGFILLLLGKPTLLMAQSDNNTDITVTRLPNQPAIHPGIHPSIGENIQGPTVIRVPEWVRNPLGRYYMYFADHKGLYIRLAYADEITGPWQIHAPGSLQIAESYFLPEPPDVSPERLDELVAARQANGVKYSHDWVKELTTPHIASPDVTVDENSQQIIMYYHGLADVGTQFSRVATSTDGINFTAQPQRLGRSYMRAFQHDGMTYIMSMPGQFYRSADGFTNFETGPRLFVPNMRHSALLVRDDALYVFWTRVGDSPESILLSTIDISGDWEQWQESEEILVMQPETEWEGANSPLEPSVRSTAYGYVNQLRDPAIYIEDDDVYLFYAVGGEAGIAVAKIEF
jgi:hypothetical protein